MEHYSASILNKVGEGDSVLGVLREAGVNSSHSGVILREQGERNSNSFRRQRRCGFSFVTFQGVGIVRLDFVIPSIGWPN